MTQQQPLQGQIAFVTGAGSGIGAAITRELATAGALVVAADRDFAAVTAVAASLTQPCAAVQAVHLDVTSAEAVSLAMDTVMREHGQLDVLVNCAGILTEVPLLEMPLETWDQMIEVDLRSVFLCCRFAAPTWSPPAKVESSTSHLNWHSRAVSH